MAEGAAVTGSVAVEVVPDARKWAPKIREAILKDATAIGNEFGKLLGEAAADRVAAGLSKGLDAGTRDQKTKAPAKGAEVGGAFADGFKAKLDQALRALPAIKLDADPSKADRAIALIRTEIAALSSKKIGIDISAEEALAKVDQLRASLAQLEAESTDIRVKVDTAAALAALDKARPEFAAEGDRAAGSFGDSFRRKLEQAFQALPDAEIKADSSDADRAIAAIRTELGTLKDVRVGVDISAADAQVKLTELKARLDALGAESPDVRIKVDAAAAAARIGEFQAEVDRVNGEDATVNVDVDTGVAEGKLAALRAQAAGAGGSFSLLTLAIAGLGPALIPIAAVGAGAMAAIATGALAAAGGVGVLLLALAPIISAIQAVTQEQTKAGSATTAAASKAIQLANANDALRASTKAVQTATLDAASARIRADERVSDAERALATTAAQASADQVTGARNVAAAERNLEDAQKSATQAQQALTDARRQYALDQEDLASRLANGQLSEREDVIRLTEAKQQLAAVNADPRSTDLDRQKAQLAVDQAIQGLSDQQRENQRLADQKATNDKAGVDGSASVKSAQDQLDLANRKVADSQQAVADASRAAAAQQAKDAQDLIKAQRDVADAVRESQDQQRHSADAIAQAQQAVVAAHRGVQQAATAAGTAGGSAMDTARQKLAALTPEGRKFVTFVTGTLIPAFHGLSDVAQTGFLPGLQAGLKSLLPLLPGFKTLVGDIAIVLGTLAREAGKALAGPFWRQFFDFVAKIAGPTLLTMGRTVGLVAQGFAGLLEAFAPISTQFGTVLLDLAKKFAGFGAGLGTNPAFQAFLKYIQDNGPKVGAALSGIVTAALHIVVALSPLGPIILDIVTKVTRFISALDPNLIRAIVLGIVAFQVALAAVAVVAAVIESPIIFVVAAIVALAAAAVYAYFHFQTFRDVVDAAWEGIKTASLFAWQNILQPTFAAISGFITGTLAPAFVSLWQDYIVPAWSGISTAVGVAWGIIKVIFGAIAAAAGVVGGVFTNLYRNLIYPAWTGIRAIIEFEWSFIQVIFKLIVAFVRDVLGPIFTWLYNTIIKPVWDKISSTISTVWNSGIKPVLQLLGDFISTTVAPAFKKGVDAIAAAWNKVIEVAKTPVRFIVNTVINGGIIDTWNKIAGFFGVSTVQHVVLPSGFADGGVVPGYAPGVDSVPAVLSPGEGILRPEVVRALGPETILGWNARAKATGRAFADGGIVGNLVGSVTSAFSGVGSDLLQLLTNPAGFIKNAIAGATSALATVGNSPFAKLVSAVPTKAVSAVTSKVTTLLANLGSGSGGAGVQQWQSTALQALALAGQPPAWIGSLLRRMNQESGGNPTAVNRTDSNWLAGTPSVGLMQVIGPTFRAYAGALAGRGPFLYGTSTDPLANIYAAIRYTVSRYGSGPAGWDRPGGYDSGGYLPPGLSTVYNGTGRPEPVLTGSQWDAVRQGGGSSISIENLTIEMPATGGSLDMLSPADRIRAATSIRDELVKLEGAQR